MDKPLSKRELNTETISNLCKQIGKNKTWIKGGCGSFALGLSRFLSKNNINSQIYAIQLNDEDNPLWNHVFLRTPFGDFDAIGKMDFNKWIVNGEEWESTHLVGPYNPESEEIIDLIDEKTELPNYQDGIQNDLIKLWESIKNN